MSASNRVSEFPTGLRTTWGLAQRRLRWIVAGMILCGLGVLLPTLTANAETRRVVEIEIRNLSFMEVTLEVLAGTTVRWINRDPVAHTSTSVDGVWESPLIESDRSYEFTFEKEGVYSYYCVPHPFMKGKVIVTA